MTFRFSAIEVRCKLTGFWEELREIKVGPERWIDKCVDQQYHGENDIQPSVDQYLHA